MQLTCKVNQPEAIRRGFNANSTVKLDVDPATLNQEERETLAEHFRDGEFRTGADKYSLKEPTMEGLIESLTAITHDKRLKFAEDEKRRLEAIKRAAQSFEERKTKHEDRIIYADNFAGTVQVCTEHQSDRNTRGRSIYRHIFADPGLSFGVPAHTEEWNRLMATPEGIAWQAELDSLNATAKAQAEQEAIKNFHRNAELAREKAAKLESLRQWACLHGSETLRLRAEEELAWKEMAQNEWAITAVRNAGIQDELLADPENCATSAASCEQPTAEQIKNLRRFRDALGDLAKCSLLDCTYTPQCIEYDEDIIERTEIYVSVKSPLGDAIELCFMA